MLPLVDAHGEVLNLRCLLEKAVVFALEEVIEPGVGERVVVEPGIAHAAFADDGVLLGALVATVKSRGDDRVLLVCGLTFSGGSDEVVSSEIWAGGDVGTQVMNQKPGTLIGMVSDCQMPPLRHAGSLGVRWIIAPPVVLGILSEKMPFGPPTAEIISCSGRC